MGLEATNEHYQKQQQTLLDKIETLKGKIGELLVFNTSMDRESSQVTQVVEESEAFLQLSSELSKHVSDPSILQLNAMLSNILSRILQMLIDCTSSSTPDSIPVHPNISSASFQDNNKYTLPTKLQQDDSLFGASSSCSSWGHCYLQQFYYWSSCSYQAVIHYDKLSIASCEDEDILHVVNTIYETYKDNFKKPPSEVKNIQHIQSQLYQTVLCSMCEWDFTSILVESVEYILQGNSLAYLVDSLCLYILDCGCWNNIYGWKMMGSFVVMMEVLLSKVTELENLKNVSCTRATPLYVQFMLSSFFSCSECSTRRCRITSTFQGIVMSILQIYKLQNYSQAILSLYLDLFYLFSSSSLSYRMEMESLFPWMTVVANGDWIQEMNNHYDSSSQHKDLLSETVLFILRWLPYSYVSKIGYHRSSIPFQVYRSPYRLDWLLLALERQYQQRKLIFSANQNSVSNWIQLMTGYLLSIYVVETASPRVCYEKVITEHIWKWLSVDCFSLWRSSLVLLATVGRSWLQMLSENENLDIRQGWIVIERLVSLLQIEKLTSSQKTMLAWTIVFMWPGFTLSKNCQSLETKMATQEKNLVARFLQSYANSSSLQTSLSSCRLVQFWIQHYQQQ